ncbi:MAG: hypothetical protein QGF90_16870 [Gammaproteobacteria bacterium]|nr:hypothetical protein [Gammaproteobacteria bacterium]
MDLLGWQLAAGIDAASALKNMARLIPINQYQRSITGASGAVQEGQTLISALDSEQLIPSIEIRGVLSAAEAAVGLAKA